MCNAVLDENRSAKTFPLAQQTQHEMFCTKVRIVKESRFLGRKLQGTPCRWFERYVDILPRLDPPWQDLVECLLDPVGG
ncbi:MAG TPA: hypothetical protein VKJ47_17110 [Candidatus Binatia bacterium]|nr:hypothetical protein [Candidatus Binatia bacterium]